MNAQIEDVKISKTVSKILRNLSICWIYGKTDLTISVRVWELHNSGRLSSGTVSSVKQPSRHYKTFTTPGSQGGQAPPSRTAPTHSTQCSVPSGRRYRRVKARTDTLIQRLYHTTESLTQHWLTAVLNIWTHTTHTMWHLHSCTFVRPSECPEYSNSIAQLIAPEFIHFLCL